jgi:hypothetical protein
VQPQWNRFGHHTVVVGSRPSMSLAFVILAPPNTCGQSATAKCVSMVPNLKLWALQCLRFRTSQLGQFRASRPCPPQVRLPSDSRPLAALQRDSGSGQERTLALQARSGETLHLSPWSDTAPEQVVGCDSHLMLGHRFPFRFFHIRSKHCTLRCSQAR